MIYQSLTQILRNLWRHKSFTLINLLGLSLGIFAVATLALVVQYESNFDNFHSNGDNIYRVVSKIEHTDALGYEANLPYPTGRFLRDEMTGLIATQIHDAGKMQIKIGNNEPFSQKNVVFADSMFFQVLDFAKLNDFWLSGNPNTALDIPNTALLTESIAKLYFGDKNPVGELVLIDNKVDVEIVGVIKDPPATSHLPLTVIVSFSTLNDELLGGLDINSWSFTSGGYAYVRLRDQQNLSNAEAALEAIVKMKAASGNKRKEIMYLQPFEEIHLDPSFENSNIIYTVSPMYLTMLILLGGFILLIACVNYVNLCTSFAFTRSKEVGIRKTIGASEKQLFFHYMTETFVLTAFAAFIGVILAIIFVPTINSIMEKSISASTLIEPLFLTGIFTGVVLISFLSGSYPAIILSGFNPISSLKNQVAIPGKSSVVLRKGLVVFQFATSIALIICTIVISRQMEFFQNKELGFKKEGVIEVRLPTNDNIKLESFRAMLENEPGVEEISFCLGAPISGSGLRVGLKAAQLPEDIQFTTRLIPCDRNYMETYELPLLAGRWFLSSEEEDVGSAVVINKSLAETLGFADPEEALGNIIELGLNNIRPVIVGVTEDFHTSSLHENIGSVALTPFPYFHQSAGIKLNAGNMRSTMALIEDSWKKVYPGNVYEVAFIDETLAAKYKQEDQNYQLFKAFTFISIFICCIGLWGLISFVIVRKTREIGIRKVLGASVSGIVALLSRDFLILIAIALLIASPLAWYFMDNWLQNFAYRINISWLVFAGAGFFAILLAFITICYQTVKAALANPVKNLRIE